MAAGLQLDCPHCGCRNSFFLARSEAIPAANPNTRSVLLQCAVNDCQQCVVAQIWSPNRGNVQAWLGGAGSSSHWHVVTAPNLPVAEAPRNVPQEIAERYIEALQNHHDRRDFSAAGTFRACLEMAVRDIHQADGRPRLSDLLKKLDPDRFPKSLRELALKIANSGNKALHEGARPSHEEVDILKQFAETFLTYAYTMKH